MELKRKLDVTMHVINGVCSVLAVVVFTFSMWLRFEWDYKHYVYELEAEKILWTGPYILMASSVLTMGLCVLGIRAVFVEDRRHLLYYAIGTGVAAMIGLGGAAYALNHGIFRSDLTEWLEERFWELFHEMDTNERSARIMRIIQIDIECCGPSDWRDYPMYNKEVPNECRNQNTGNIMSDSCSEEFALWLEPKTGWLTGIALLLVTIQLLAVGISLWLRWIIKQERTENKTYRVVQVR